MYLTCLPNTGDHVDKNAICHTNHCATSNGVRNRLDGSHLKVLHKVPHTGDLSV